MVEWASRGTRSVALWLSDGPRYSLRQPRALVIVAAYVASAALTAVSHGTDARDLAHAAFLASGVAIGTRLHLVPGLWIVALAAAAEIALRLGETPGMWIVGTLVWGALGALVVVLSYELVEYERRRLSLTSIAGARGVLAALDARHHATYRDSLIIGGLARETARRMGVASEHELERIYRVAVLHDIGMIVVPAQIIEQRESLSEPETCLIRQHPIYGEEIIASVPELSELGPLVRATHERWDGGGYPDGLAGEEIPLAARLVSACESYQASTHSHSQAQAIDALRAGAGSQFDPAVVEALITVLTSNGDEPHSGDARLPSLRLLPPGRREPAR